MIPLFFRNYLRLVCWIGLGMCLLLLDFVSKAFVFNILGECGSCDHLSIPIFYDFFGIDFFISLATNRGAAWGLLADFQMPLLILRMVTVAGMFIYLFFLNRNRHAVVPLILIITGALGNIIDFFLYGFVIDFLHFNLWGNHFPIFNFADASITIGVIGLFFASYFTHQPKEKENVGR